MAQLSTDVKSYVFCTLIWLPSVLFAMQLLPIRPGEIGHAFDPGYGMQAVPGEVAEMKLLAERHSVDTFSLDAGFRNNVVIFQRAVEYLYPVRLDQGAKLVMVPAGAALPGCRPVESGRWVSLHECP